MERDTRAELERIVTRFLEGHTSEYRTIRKRVMQYIAHQRSLELAQQEDLASEVIAVLVQCFRDQHFRGDSIQALNVFIYNTVRNQLTHLKRRRECTPEEPFSLANNPDLAQSTDQVVADQLLVARIYRELDLPCRHLLWMRFHLQWSDQEIADYLQKSKNAVSTAICRCLKKARNLNFLKDIE